LLREPIVNSPHSKQFKTGLWSRFPLLNLFKSSTNPAITQKDPDPKLFVLQLFSRISALLRAGFRAPAAAATGQTGSASFPKHLAQREPNSTRLQTPPKAWCYGREVWFTPGSSQQSQEKAPQTPQFSSRRRQRRAQRSRRTESKQREPRNTARGPVRPRRWQPEVTPSS